MAAGHCVVDPVTIDLLVSFYAFYRCDSVIIGLMAAATATDGFVSGK